MKAMILAAGRGERLRPLTDRVPKPLVSVRGKPLIEWHLEGLARAGFHDVVINVSHLGSLVEQALGSGDRWGLRIAWSREAVPLETAGGIANARGLLGKLPFALLNADVFCDFELAGLRSVQLGKILGHMILVPNPAFRPQGDFSLVGGRVGCLTAPRYTYSGLCVLDPSIVDATPQGAKAPLGPLLHCAARAGRLSGELYAGRWSDVGTPERLDELNRTDPQ